MFISKNIKLLKINSKIYAAVVKCDYERTMLFCKAQEFYESPNTSFRGKKFSIWDYIKWYSLRNNNSFSYPKDWTGFNIPCSKLIECYSKNKIESPYDILMLKIINKIKNKDSYLIGVKKLGDSIFKHELCHAFYGTNPQYKLIADGITNSIPKKIAKNIENNLINIGYAKSFLKDEIQAYFIVDYKFTRFNRNVCKKDMLFYHNIYKKELCKLMRIEKFV